MEEAELHEVEEELELVSSEIEHLLSRQQELQERREQLLRRVQADQLAPRRDWDLEDFPFSTRVQQLLKNPFCLNSFRCGLLLCSPPTFSMRLCVPMPDLSALLPMQAAAAAGHQRHAAGQGRALPHAQRGRQEPLLPAARPRRRNGPHAGRLAPALSHPGPSAHAESHPHASSYLPLTQRGPLLSTQPMHPCKQALPHPTRTPCAHAGAWPLGPGHRGCSPHQPHAEGGGQRHTQKHGS